MKAGIFSYVVLFGLAVGAHSQESWVNPNPLPIRNDLNSVNFTSDMSGFAVGTRGIVLKTTDNGSTWSFQNSGTSNTLNSVFFTDADTGYAVGNGGTVLSTTDGGSSWSVQNSGVNNNLRSVHFSDAYTGFAVGDSGVVVSTADGGATWTALSSNTTQNLHSVHFTDAYTGFAVGDSGVILTTTTGGTQWFVQTVVGSASYNLLSVQFTDIFTGYAVGKGVDMDGNGVGAILKTTDGGETWSFQNDGWTSGLTSVHFTDESTGYAVGDSGTILKTTNGGGTWSFQYSGTTRGFNSVSFASGDASSTGFVVGNSALILKHVTAVSRIAGRNVSDKSFGMGKNNSVWYQLDKRSRVEANLFDMRGRLAMKLVNEVQEAGRHEFIMPSQKMPHGSYILNFRSAGIRKIIQVQGN